MVGQAPTSLVSGDKTARRLTVGWLGALNAGFILGSAALFGIVTVITSAIGINRIQLHSRAVAFLIIGALLLVFDLLAATRDTYSLLGLRRQTPKTFERHLRSIHLVALAWAFDIGTGISTYRMTSAIWLGIAAIALHLAPGYLGCLYGIGLAVSISLTVTFVGGGSRLHHKIFGIRAARRWVQFAYAASVMLVGAAAIESL